MYYSKSAFKIITQFYFFQVQKIHTHHSFWGSQCTSPIQEKCHTELNATKMTLLQQIPYLQYSPLSALYMDNTLCTTTRDNRMLLTRTVILQTFTIIYVKLKCMVSPKKSHKMNMHNYTRTSHFTALVNQ